MSAPNPRNMHRTWLYLVAMSLLLLTNAARAWAQSEPKIRIVSPRDRGIVALGEVTVTIETENFTLDAEHHWHLYVDGELRSMVGNGEKSWTTRIATSGPHEIRAALSDSQHDDVASTTIEVTAAPATPRGSPFNIRNMSLVIGALVVFVGALLLFAIRYTRRTRLD